ncbi:DUF1330 domain-containing protein (plasmid) [Gemmobacter fulvus]|uniref:DUF1330 domain-containing protein n=1 Tax=Gemmobacter fulvus TaxID=2840474 RepID=A0A975PB73_9RHOB|nr:DUF1330 domain-containing protein [Gemmobacter fulvus]MBT9246214.1 DUF1330 domain-containing protein [Gemmobacter fulvus]MDQ1850177.1 DUF1330 domain-containing protein [Gemmobacter fulvus]QWK92428.1 DUF1330 domain-containing protein [Gemmobacter fulvus]
MAAYFIAHGTVKDAAKMLEYVDRSGPCVAAFGGEFLTVGEVKSVLTGRHDHKRTAIFKFPDVAAAEGWYNSDAYRALWPLRNAAGDFDFIVMEEF